MAKNIVNAVLLSLLIFLLGGYVCFAGEVEWQDIGRGNINLRTVLADSDNSNIIYIGSEQGIFKSEDGGGSWRSILSARGTNKGVNFLLFSSDDKNSLCAATGDGLYFSHNQGRNWSRIFKGKNYLENECTALAILPYAIYLGTKAGLFVSKNKGRSWHRETAQLGNTHILAIAYSLKEPNYLYVACINGVFKSKDSGQSWERTFITQPTENGNETEEITEDQDEQEKSSNLRYINIDPNNSNYLYLASGKGVYRSRDRGLTWESVSSYGLLSRDVKLVLISEQSDIYALTKSGIFEYSNERWQEISFNIAAGEFRFLACDKRGNLYVVCDRGIFKTQTFGSDSGKQDNLTALYAKDEPDIQTVQQAAITYAEVEPEKIKLWREQARKKAILPQLSIGIDRNTSDLWHWEGGSTTKTDDDILRRGRDSIDWDITLSWDLSELIWNDDQTSIDVRSRLMVELRQDVLDEVTKLYFERIRVKMELDSLSIEDRKKRVEKELRLNELAASLDALTGGLFSQYRNKAKENSPI